MEEALDQAISSLDPKYREVLVLRDVEGLTAREVAEVLGIGVDAVKSRLHRARLAVRAALSPLLGVPAGDAAAPASCPDVLTLLSRHLEDELSPEVCSEMERHLQSCGRCRGACESLRRTLRLCQTAPAVSVPEGVQKSVRAALRAFLDERS
jgi:RNA polymerase sigma-70 factor (ECF subfamily)